jgi:hypothetical protein
MEMRKLKKISNYQKIYSLKMKCMFISFNNCYSHHFLDHFPKMKKIGEKKDWQLKKLKNNYDLYNN